MDQRQGIVFAIRLRPRSLILPGVLLAGLAALLLCNTETSARYAPAPGDPPAELRLVPPDTLFVAHLNVAALLKQESAKEISKMMLSWFMLRGDAGESAFGVKLSDIESLAFLSGERHNVGVVTTQKAIDRDKVIKAIAPGGVEQTFKDKKFFAPKSRFKDKKRGDFKKDGDSPKDEKPRDNEPDESPKDRFKDGKDVKKEGGFQEDKISLEEKKDRRGRDDRFDPWAPAVYFLSDRSFVSGNAESVQHFLATAEKLDESSPLFNAVSVAGKNQVTLGLAMPEEMRRKGEQQLRREARFSPEMGAFMYSFKPLLSAKGGVLTVNFDDETRIGGAVTFADARNAELGVDSIKLGLGVLKGGLLMIEDQMQEAVGELKPDSPVLKLTGNLRTALNDATIKAEGKTVKVSLKAKTDAETVKAIVAEAAVKVQAAANRAQSTNNLKQLTLAMINCADSFDGRMPDAVVYSKDGKPLYSWRVTLLPYLDQAPLYNQLKLDEPWDSEHNKPLLAKAPKVFQLPGVKADEGMTYYQIFSGAGILSEKNRPVRYPVSFTDGTSLTILIAESAEPVHWAAPKDIPYSEKVSPLKQIGKHHGKGTLVSMADGSVRMVPATVTERDFRAAITPSGGEVIGPSFGEEDDEDDFRGGGRKTEYKDKDKVKKDSKYSDKVKDGKYSDKDTGKESPKDKFKPSDRKDEK
jgi:Protein of unknown function (DUF1559)